MALSSITLGTLIDANLDGDGAVGPNRTIFSNAIAKGVVDSLVGVTFTTSDVGTGTGGTGSGTGIIGLNSTIMSTTALSSMSSIGVNAPGMMNAIMSAVVSHLNTSSTLTTTNPTVGDGVGIINIGSFSITIGIMSSNILLQLEISGANGENRQNLALSIATGIVSNILSSGTKTITISGGSPGGVSAGTGTGVIS